jgi:hypothetical protein
MAGNNHFLSYIYGIDGPGGSTEISFAGGAANSFPSAGTRFYPAPANYKRGVAQVTMNAAIVVLPVGLNQQPTTFWTADTVSTLNTNAT